jgi:hypothetical protein
MATAWSPAYTPPQRRSTPCRPDWRIPGKRLPAQKAGALYKTDQQYCGMVLERPFRPASFGTERAPAGQSKSLATGKHFL